MIGIPSIGFERLPEHNRKAKKKSLTLDEAKRFLTTLEDLKNENARRLIRILLFTGIRRSELLYIEREDVDMRAGTFQSMNIKSGDRHKVSRQIPEQVWSDFNYFMHKTGSHRPFKVCHPDTFTHWVKLALRAVGLSEDLHLHSLRHTFISLGLERGSVTVRQMQKYVDHAKLSTTELYIHDEAGTHQI